MKRIHRNLCLILVAIGCSFVINAQSVIGTWKTVDDETGEQKALVEIYKKGDKIFGKIVEIFDKSKRDLPCKFCEGDDYNKPVLGLNIIKSMEKDDDVYEDGTITDPENGKVYRCRLKLTDDPDVLQVRGYIAFFYKTQYWNRVD